MPGSSHGGVPEAMGDVPQVHMHENPSTVQIRLISFAVGLLGFN